MERGIRNRTRGGDRLESILPQLYSPVSLRPPGINNVTTYHEDLLLSIRSNSLEYAHAHAFARISAALFLS